MNSEEENISDARYSHISIDEELRALKKDYKKRTKKSKTTSTEDSREDES